MVLNDCGTIGMSQFDNKTMFNTLPFYFRQITHISATKEVKIDANSYGSH